MHSAFRSVVRRALAQALVTSVRKMASGHFLVRMHGKHETNSKPGLKSGFELTGKRTPYRTLPNLFQTSSKPIFSCKLLEQATAIRDPYKPQSKMAFADSTTTLH